MSEPANKAERAEWFFGLSAREQEKYNRRKGWLECMDPTHNAALFARARRRMDRVDALQPELRAVVYEHNLEVVQPFLDHGVKRASHIDFLIRFVLGADVPYADKVYRQFYGVGVHDRKRAKFLIDTVLGTDFPNGQRRFKLNLGPNTKQNPIAADDDDEAYYVLGPIVSRGTNG